MLTPYRRVLALPGALAFSATGVVARLPIAMSTLGIVILVSSSTGSYAVAGVVSAAFIAAQAVCAVPLARLVDRLGQRRVLGVATTVSTAALGMLIVAVQAGWVAPWPHVFAAVAGATMPNVGAAVRARWSHAVEDRQLLGTAFAVEAVNDEMVFIVGPTLTTLLAAVVHPLAGLVAACLAAVTGTWALVAQRRTEPPRQRFDDGAGAAHPMPWRDLLPLVVGAAALGVVFGGSEVAVVAFAEERGRPAVAGVLLAVWGLGSLLAGIVSGALTFRSGAPTRYRAGLLALALLMVPLPLVEGLAVLAGLLFLAGFAISPTLIAAASWVEAIVPRDRLNEGMTVLTAGLVAGMAPGAAGVGMVIERAGVSASFWVPATAGLVGAAVAFLTSARTHPARAVCAESESPG